MLRLVGARFARIKKFTDTQDYCPNCHLQGLDIKIYRKYFHVFYLPCFPYGKKLARVTCKHCGQDVEIDSLINRYENKLRTPVYLYTLPILFLLLIIFSVIEGRIRHKELEQLVANPNIGDVYHIEREQNNGAQYFFLRLDKFEGDSLVFYHSNYQYHELVYEFGADDYFEKTGEWKITREKLRQWLEKGEITQVDRGYDRSNGFNKIE
jgi:hypothetical protein